MQGAEICVFNSAFRIVTTQNSKCAEQTSNSINTKGLPVLENEATHSSLPVEVFIFPFSSLKHQLWIQALLVGKVWGDSTDPPPLLSLQRWIWCLSFQIFQHSGAAQMEAARAAPLQIHPQPKLRSKQHRMENFLYKKKHWHNLVIPLFKIPIIWFKNTTFVGSWLLLHWDSLIQSCVLFSGGMPHVFIFQSLISANSSISARSKVVLLFRSAIFFPKWTKWKVDAQRYLKIIIKNI